MPRKPVQTLKTRPNLTELETTQIIYSLAIGVADYRIMKQFEIGDGTLISIKKNRFAEIQKATDKMKKKIGKDSEKEMNNVVKDIFKLIKRAYSNISDEKLAGSSAAQLATITGILIDKHQILTGNCPETVNVNLNSKDQMIEYLTMKKKIATEGLDSLGIPTKTRREKKHEEAVKDKKIFDEKSKIANKGLGSRGGETG
jgi:hypothetical protein